MLQDCSQYDVYCNLKCIYALTNLANELAYILYQSTVVYVKFKTLEELYSVSWHSLPSVYYSLEKFFINFEFILGKETEWV